ncbi:hemolysin family protein [Chloroflexota bacterium]
MISVGYREGTVEEHEARLLHKVFEFGDRPVREVMIPRPEVVAIERGSTVADFLNLYRQSPLSRFPVYEESMDTVVGVLSVKEVLMGLAKNTVTQTTLVDDLMRPAYFTPDTKPTDELFVEMRDENYRIAVVVDEFGGTAGIISLSGLAEEIVGDVGDELAAVEKEFKVINDFTYHVDGSMRVDDANRELDLNIPDGDYDTVAGFLLLILGHIPRVKESVRHDGMKLVVLEMKGMKVEKLLVYKEQEAKKARRKGKKGSGKAPDTRQEPDAGDGGTR